MFVPPVEKPNLPYSKGPWNSGPQDPNLPYSKGPWISPHKMQPIHMKPIHGTGPVIPPIHGTGPVLQPIHGVGPVIPPIHGTGPVLQPIHGVGPARPPHHSGSGDQCHFPPPAPVRIYCQPAAFHRVDGEPYQNMSTAYGSSRPLHRYQ